MLGDLWKDIRYAVRMAGRTPAFTAIAVLTLALGIGANTAIFSLLYQILLRPLPYPSADRLVFVWNTYPLMGLPKASVSIPDYIDRKTSAPAIEDAALFTQQSMILAAEGQPEQLRALAVTPSFFSTLQRQPFLGRSFDESEAQPGADRKVILDYTLWTSRFAADEHIVDRSIRLNGEGYVVVGVLPADFELPAPGIRLLVPFAFTPEQMLDSGRGNEFSQMIARLTPAATIEQLDGQMKMIVGRNLERLSAGHRGFLLSTGFGGYAVPIREELVGDVRTALYLLQAGVIVVLLIACANVANLLLMRATGRGRDLAIRTTLGAGQWRLLRQMITESLVLSAAGAIGGLALGFAGVRALIALSTQQMDGIANASLHAPVLLFTATLAVVTGLIFGLVPAIGVIRGNTAALLREDSTRGSAGRRTGVTRATLVIVETALALVLLIGAGLLIKSYARLQGVDPGFSPQNVLTAQIALPSARYPNGPSQVAFWTRLVDKVTALPGVTAAGLTSSVPFNGNGGSGGYTIVGQTLAPGEPSPHGRLDVVGGDYFRAMQIPLLEGRAFTGADTLESPPVVVVDRYLAKRYFGEHGALGQQIRLSGRESPAMTIVGVVGTINSIDLAQPVVKEHLYLPVAQLPFNNLGVVVKTALDPHDAVANVRGAVHSIDPEQALADVRTMEQWMARSLETRRAPMTLLALFGGVALLLSAIGIYGVLAFGVSQRVREFGIRQALGADRPAILSLVLKQGLRTAGVGIVLGLAGALALTRYLQSQLFGVGAYDASVFAVVTALLLVAAAAACYIPARRATRIDPIEALRDA